MSDCVTERVTLTCKRSDFFQARARSIFERLAIRHLPLIALDWG